MYIVYGKPNCPFCEKAKGVLTAKGLEFEYKTLDEDYSRDDLLDVCRPFRVIPRTMPQIIETTEDGSQRYIGGYDQLAEELN